MLHRAFLVVGLLAPLAGCDKLFPELAGDPQDLAVVDSSSDALGTAIIGTVCHLTDLRTPQSCTTPVSGRSITIQETKATAITDANGTFSLSAAGLGATATLAVTDPQGAAASYMPTVIVLNGTTLTAARQTGVLVPAVDAQTYANVALTNGATADDTTRGAVIAWVVSPTGTTVQGAVATRITGSIGPLYDTKDGAQLETGAASGVFGAVAFMDLLPGTASITVTPPASSSLTGDTFTMPVYSGAVTVGALSLP